MYGPSLIRTEKGRFSCSGDDNWQSTRTLLTEAGVPVPEEVNSVRLTFSSAFFIKRVHSVVIVHNS